MLKIQMRFAALGHAASQRIYLKKGDDEQLKKFDFVSAWFFAIDTSG